MRPATAKCTRSCLQPPLRSVYLLILAAVLGLMRRICSLQLRLKWRKLARRMHHGCPGWRCRWTPRHQRLMFMLASTCWHAQIRWPLPAQYKASRVICPCKTGPVHAGHGGVAGLPARCLVLLDAPPAALAAPIPQRAPHSPRVRVDPWNRCSARHYVMCVKADHVAAYRDCICNSCKAAAEQLVYRCSVTCAMDVLV